MTMGMQRAGMVMAVWVSAGHCTRRVVVTGKGAPVRSRPQTRGAEVLVDPGVLLGRERDIGGLGIVDQ